jgi:hypothetical protein
LHGKRVFDLLLGKRLPFGAENLRNLPASFSR